MDINCLALHSHDNQGDLQSFCLHPRSLTASLPLKNDGWKTFAFPLGMVHFQGRAVKLPGSI